MKKLALIVTAVVVPLSIIFVGPLGAHAATASIGALGPSSTNASRSPRTLALSNRLAPTAVPSALSSPRLPRAATIACDGGFDVYASPNGTGHNDIFATSVLSANDVWAVGVQTNAGGFDRTLAEHWNGTAWSIVPTPNPGSTHNDLNGVAAVSSNDVWVVGDYFDSLIGGWLEFAMHWDGSAWTTTIFNYGYLFGVTAVASNDVWAVGTTFYSPFVTVVMHWNGASWSLVSSPDPSTFDNELFSVSAFSSTDVWAVGEQEASNGSPLQSLAVHWNGGAWSALSTPNDAGGSNVIGAVAPLEGGHAVGVGYGGFVNGVSAAHGETWDLLSGGSSTDAPLAGPGSGDNILEGVAVSGAGVSAVGFWRSTTSSARQTLAFPGTWNSSSHTLTWGSIGTSASPGSANNALFTVSAVSPSVFWAAGYANSGGFDQSLIESYCGLHLGMTGPASSGLGSAFSLTVTAKDPGGTTLTGYRGTVHFTSSDPAATLPGDYTFTPGDLGVHTFSGVVLRTPYTQTITVADTATPFVRATVSINVFCVGVCQAPLGTPGTRATNQSPTGAPLPRISRHLLPASSDGSVGATSLSTAGAGWSPPITSSPLSSSPSRLTADTGGVAHNSVSSESRA